METLKFGKFKGYKFSETPTWYQAWLLKQDWFKPNNKPSNNESYALIENGVIHTPDLDFESATEMKERHSRFFPSICFEVLPMSAVYGMDKAEGFLERHSRISRRYA